MPLDGPVHNKGFAICLYSTIILGVVGISIDSCSKSKAAKSPSEKQGIEKKVGSHGIDAARNTTGLAAEQNDLSLFLQDHLVPHYKRPLEEKDMPLYPENPAILPADSRKEKATYKKTGAKEQEQISGISKKHVKHGFNPGTWTKVYK